MGYAADESPGGRHQTPTDTRSTGFHCGTSGSSPLLQECQNTQAITGAHQAHAGGGMLQAEHSEEALGGSDNTAPCRVPEGCLSTVGPSSAPHVFPIIRAFPQAQFSQG